jgi:hypothetical protein
VSEDAPAKKEDVVFVHGPAEGGEGLRVIRKRDEVIELGELRSVQEGKPLHGELVKLSPREDNKRLFDVEVVVPREETQSGHAALKAKSGPAQVASEAYREGWEAIFGAREEPGLPN